MQAHHRTFLSGRNGAASGNARSMLGLSNASEVLQRIVRASELQWASATEDEGRLAISGPKAVDEAEILAEERALVRDFAQEI